MRLPLLAFAALLASVAAAEAHPHVWVTSVSKIAYDAQGRVTGVHQDWTFDDMFSSFATQGLDKDGDGKLSKEELQPLAQTNVESLKEFEYFTFAKLGGKKLLFKEPIDYWLDDTNNILTLHFFLPLSTPQHQGQKALAVEIYDPTYYVDFALADKDPAALAGAPQGCTLNVIRPNTPDDAQVADAVKLDQEYFRQLDANRNFGEKFANHILVNCP
jgi:ABC-type uncharacterized transport system substrate-binding protein